ELNMWALAEASFGEPWDKPAQKMGCVRGCPAADQSDPRKRRLLRARRERPCCRRAAEKRNELAPLHLSDPKPRTMPSIAGQARASQQKRPACDRLGSIAPDRHDRDARPMSASRPIVLQNSSLRCERAIIESD